MAKLARLIAGGVLVAALVGLVRPVHAQEVQGAEIAVEAAGVAAKALEEGGGVSAVLGRFATGMFGHDAVTATKLLARDPAAAAWHMPELARPSYLEALSPPQQKNITAGLRMLNLEDRAVAPALARSVSDRTPSAISALERFQKETPSTAALIRNMQQSTTNGLGLARGAPEPASSAVVAKGMPNPTADPLAVFEHVPQQTPGTAALAGGTEQSAANTLAVSGQVQTAPALRSMTLGQHLAAEAKPSMMCGAPGIFVGYVRNARTGLLTFAVCRGGAELKAGN